MKQQASSTARKIRVGIGGWRYAPWRETFYPAGLVQAQELDFASRQVSAIEINSTFYGSQKPATFAKWHAQTPDDFMFALKAPRHITHRRDLGDAKESIARFIDGGPAEPRHKLGPIVWQLAPTKRFVAEEFESFLALLPQRLDQLTLRHALDLRHASFDCEQVVQLARKYRAALVHTDTADVPVFTDVCSDFVYARLRSAQAHITTGYSAAALRRWADAARAWHAGGVPDGMEMRLALAPAKARDTFVFFINGAKERAPAAAMRLLELLQKKS